MEYVSSAFKKVNGKNAENIVLYLCQHRDREVTRRELLEKLPLNMDDFIFSRSGFTKEAEDYRKEKGIACSEDEKWLETGK